MSTDLLFSRVAAYIDGNGRQHRRVHNRISGDHCTCLEAYPCRAILLAVAGDNHPVSGQCVTCQTAAPCWVRRDLLDQAVTS